MRPAKPCCPLTARAMYQVARLRTAPSPSPAATTRRRRTTRATDLVLLPCRPSVLDVEAVADTAAPVVAVLMACAPRGQDADQVAAALAGVDVQVAPVRIGQRIVLARSLLAGQVAQEQEPDGRAAAEVAAVHAFIVRTLEQREHPNTTRGGSMSSPNTYATALQDSAPGRRPTAASRQGRRHVGAYVPPKVARQLRVIAAQEDSSTQAAHRAGYRVVVSVAAHRPRRGVGLCCAAELG